MKKVLKAIRKAAQPIPPSEIKKHLVAQLRVDAALEKARRITIEALLPAKADFKAMCDRYNVKQDEWAFDLTEGTMTRIKTPAEKTPSPSIDAAITPTGL